MGKTLYKEIDEFTFQSIKRGFVENKTRFDEEKYFKNLDEGDKIIFQNNGEKIEGVIKKIEIFTTLHDYLKNKNVQDFSFECNNPISMLEICDNNNQKKYRFFTIEYNIFNNDNDNEDDVDLLDFLQNIIKKD